MAASLPGPNPTPFQGEIFYNIVHTSFEPAIHMHYIIKGRKIRMDLVEIDENDPTQTKILKVLESSFVTLPDPLDKTDRGKIQAEEKGKNFLFEEPAAAEGFQAASTPKALAASNREKTAEGAAVANYEETYGYSIQKEKPSLKTPPGAKTASLEKDFTADIWTAGEPQTIKRKKGGKLVLESVQGLKDSPFPMVLHVKKPQKVMRMPNGKRMGHMHDSYWMYAVKVIPRPVSDEDVTPDLKSPTKNPEQLQGLLSQPDLFNERFKTATPTPTPKP